MPHIYLHASFTFHSIRHQCIKLQNWPLQLIVSQKIQIFTFPFNSTVPQQLEQSSFVPYVQDNGLQDRQQQQYQDQVQNEQHQKSQLLHQYRQNHEEDNEQSRQEQPQKSQQPVQNEWWGSLLNTAQNGLETARVIAKDTARVVKESQTVRDFGGKKGRKLYF